MDDRSGLNLFGVDSTIGKSSHLSSNLLSLVSAMSVLTNKLQWETGFLGAVVAGRVFQRPNGSVERFIFELETIVLSLVLLFCGSVGFCLFGCIGRNKDVWLRAGHNYPK